ncbi:type II secretion system inner membrane protein GspF [Glaciecola sp. 1036]|uniref:type II secretion system inner membrane protein GspF n=1 Tax=Alteromonadaceae TaxID=72275 RepID=UPI003D03B1C0
MAAFAYKALNSRGKNVSGVLEADTARQVRQQLREQALIPIEVETVVEKENTKSSFTLFKRKLSSNDLALITRQLATLIEAALPIEEALLAVADQCEKPSQKNMMMAVRSKVVEGHTLAHSMADFPHVFDTLYRAMVAAGEKSGHLDTVLSRLADYTEKRHQTASQVTQALVYPVIMMLVAISVVVLLLTWVVPQIVGQFDTMGQELPLMTRILIAVSDWLREYGIFAGIFIVIAIIAFQRVLTIPRMKLAWHKRLLNMPLIGRLSRGTNTARFAQTLSILSASAVPLLEAMKISADVLANQYLRAQVSEAAVKVKEGSSLRAALGQTKAFPPMMLHMIASGEKSGELQQMLKRAADNQERQFEATVNVSLKIFEPILIISMAAIVLFIVMAILLPILALNNLVG